MQLIRRLATLLRPSRNREWAEEMRFHLEQKVADGASRTEAERAFGNELRLRERAREAWGWLWLEQLGRDLRHTVRLLQRSPGFAAVAILSLALGIGVNVAVFSLVDAVALRPLAVAHADQLVRLDWSSRAWDAPRSWGTNFNDSEGRTIHTYFSYPLFLQWERRQRTVDALLAYQVLPHVDVSAGGHAAVAQATLVSGGYQSALGLRAALGRGLAESDLLPGAPAVALLSYAYWQQRFGEDRGAVGRVIEINHVPVTVVGVESRGFDGLEVGTRSDVFLPLSLGPALAPPSNVPYPRLSDPQAWYLEVVARLRPGVSPGRARADLGLIFQQQLAALPPAARPTSGDRPVLLASSAAHGVSNISEDLRLPVEILFTLTGLVLLIVCVNLANLLLARTAARQGELAIRAAIGAGRLALLRQLLAESVALALAGAVLALPVALAAAGAIVAAFVPAEFSLTPHLDLPAAGFALALALLAGFLTGIFPAWRATRPQPAQGVVAARSRVGEILLVGQIGLCLLVLSTAGLLLRTLHNFESAPVGLDPAQITLFRLDAGLEGYAGPRLDSFYQDALERLRGLPGVTSASATEIIPGSTGGWTTRDISVGASTPSSPNPDTHLDRVSPDFFATYRIPVLAGRDFSPRDQAGAPAVAIVNGAFGRRFSGSALGQTLYWQTGRSSGKLLRVVGVVADAAYEGVRQTATPVLYLPIAQQPTSGLTFAVRSRLPRPALIEAIRGAISGLDPQVPVFGVETQAEAMARSYGSAGMLAPLAAILATLALLLVALGLYGLMAFQVTCRRREIGVRLALGARPSGVIRLVLRQSFLLVAGGVALGAPLAWFGGQALRSQLYGVSPSDPTTLVGAVLFLLAVTIGATMVPARRAARTDPMAALRCE